MFKRLSNNSRPYVIHLNVHHQATPINILEAYTFARMLDKNLPNTFDQNSLQYDVEKAIRRTEWYYVNEFDSDKLAEEIKDKGWSL